MPGPFTEDIARLIQLDALDQELLALQAEQVETPQALETRRGDIAAASEARDAIASELQTQEAKQRDAERELEEVERRQARAHKRMESLSTNEQIAATEREIAKLGEQIDTLEGDVLEVMEEVDGLTERLASATSAIDGAQAGLDADKATWDPRQAVITGRIAELEAAIGEVKPTIGAEAAKAYLIGYENRGNRHHRGATFTDGVMCTMCRTEAPARWVNEARNGDGIHRCLGCKRVLVGAAPKTEGADDEESEEA
ncbi:MAG: hypothetical protein KDA24_13815 [Deltaproteobacteria bacterium]|nr:hypothetical protein [Deltaproteobacteria bacterium]